MRNACPIGAISLAVLVVTLFVPEGVWALGGRLGLHAVRLEANGVAEDLSEPSWGGGLEIALTVPGLRNLVAGTAGFEIVKFESRKLVSRSGLFSFRRELDTSQDFARILLGAEIGPHGRGFLQPYVGLHGAVVNHSVTTTLTRPDDLNPDNTLTQIENQDDWGLGYDVTLGTNLNYRNRFGVYGGVRYQQSFGLDQPLDFNGEPREIDPEYWEIFFGVSLDLGFLSRVGEEPAGEAEEGE